MKKFILTIFSAIISLTGYAADNVTIKEATINPGGNTTKITVSLSGNTDYTACEMDIYLPAGYEFVKTTTKKSYYYTQIVTTSPLFYDADDPADHTVSSEVQANGCLRVSLSSNTNCEFYEKSGDLFTFIVQANSWVKPGPIDVEIKEASLIPVYGDPLVLADQIISNKVTASTSCTLPINVTAANKWGTITSPFDITEIPAGLTAYTISGIEGENVNLSKATKIEAFKPYVLEASADVNTTLNGTVDAEAYATAVTSGLAASSNATAVYSAQNITSGYVLQNQGSEAMFYQLPSEGLKIPAGKVVVTGTSGAKALNFVVEEDEATVINKIENASNSDAIYDIQGRRVATPKHGIYIKGGKKIAM